MKKQITKFVGVIITDNSNPYYTVVISGIEDSLSKKSFFIIIFNTHENLFREYEIIKELLSIKIAGIILTTASINSKSVELMKNIEFHMC